MIWFLFPLSTSASSSQHKIFIAFLRVLSLGVNGIAVSFFGLWRSFWFWVSFESFSFYTIALKFTKKCNLLKQNFFFKCRLKKKFPIAFMIILQQQYLLNIMHYLSIFSALCAFLCSVVSHFLQDDTSLIVSACWTFSLLVCSWFLKS